MLYEEMGEGGSVVCSIEVDQDKLTSDCFMIQIKGLAACDSCPYVGTEECGGGLSLELLKG